MDVLELFFWLSLFIVFYAYVGYGILLYIIIKIRRILGIGKEPVINNNYEPEVTLFVAAYNEKDYVADKVKNSSQLNYPQDKVKQIWVTDGSDDGTPEKLQNFENVEVHHLDARGGKIGAMNRG